MSLLVSWWSLAETVLGRIVRHVGWWTGLSWVVETAGAFDYAVVGDTVSIIRTVGTDVRPGFSKRTRLFFERALIFTHNEATVGSLLEGRDHRLV
jgi:hypothetical protein